MRSTSLLYLLSDFSHVFRLFVSLKLTRPFVFSGRSTKLPNVSCEYTRMNEITYLQVTFRYYTLTRAFQSTSGSISDLVNGINAVKSACKDTTLTGSFLENHDVGRFASLTSDIALTKNAIAFQILQDGIPISEFQRLSIHFKNEQCD